MKHKIIHEKRKCIGCGVCQALCPKYFQTQEDGKSSLVGSKLNPKTGNEELEIEELNCVQQAVDACPVQCIHIINK